MKKWIVLTLILGCAFGLTAQDSIEALEKQLREASTTKEKMLLTYELSEKYLRVDADKSIDYGKRSHRLALDLNNEGQAARAAYQVALGYERERSDYNTDVWLKSAVAHAKAAGDSDLIIKSVNKRAQFATKERKHRRAAQIYEEAFAYFSKKGTSISELEGRYEKQKSQISREQQRLEEQLAEVQRNIDALSEERDQLSSDKDVLKQQTQRLSREKEEVEQEVAAKEEALVKVEEIADQERKKVKVLTREALEKEAVLAKTEQARLQAEMAQQQAESLAQKERELRNYLIGGVAFALIVALLSFFLYRSSRRKNRIIQEERERADSLLTNILPVKIAEELKENGKVKAQRYDKVTVLFSDFRNFTRIAEQLGPEDLVEELDKCFKAFDFIIGQYEDVEKIKTIGDAYMCATGLTGNHTMPHNLIRAALEMQQFLEEEKQERMRQGKPYFEARIGIHTGPVVAGVVGLKKFAYDIWGDTVNTAARVETNSEVGRVNISEDTYNLVRYKFECEYRGKVEAKNKGHLDMYFVNKEQQGAAVPA